MADEPRPAWLASEFVERVCSYMNERQPDSVLEIVRRHVDDHATSAKMVAVEVGGPVFTADGHPLVIVPWGVPPLFEQDVRHELMSLAGL